MDSEYPVVFYYMQDIDSLIDTLYLSLIERNEARFYLTHKAMQNHTKQYGYPSTTRPTGSFEKFKEQVLHGNKKDIRWTQRAQWTADVLYHRHMSMTQPEDLQKAIEIIEQEDQQVPLLMSNLVRLGAYLIERFEWSHDEVDVERSIDALKVALDLVPSSHPCRGIVVTLMMRSISGRCHTLGQLGWQDVTKMMTLCNELKSLSPTTEQSVLVLGASAMLDAHEMSDQGISLLQDVIRTLSRDDYKKGLSQLGLAFIKRFKRSRVLSDINTAVDLLYEVVKDPEGGGDQSVYLAHLGLAFLTRFEVLGDVADLEKCILQYEESVKLGISDDRTRSGMLAELSDAIHLRYLRLGEVSDLERSVDLSRRALRAMPQPGDHDLSTHNRLRRLEYIVAIKSNMLYQTRPGRYHQEAPNAQSCIDHALHISRESLRRASYAAPERFDLLSSYHKLLRDRVKSHEQAADTLLEKIQIEEERFVLIPLDDDSERLESSAEIAADWFAYHIVWRRDQPLGVLKAKEIYKLCKMVLRSKLATPKSRIMCSFLAMSVLIACPELIGGQKRWEKAFTICAEGIAVLPTRVPQYCQRNHRHRAQIDGQTLGSIAVSVGLNAGKPASHCLAVLEQSRGIILGFTIDCRSTTGNLQELQKINPDLFDKFNTLRSRVDSPSENREELLSRFPISPSTLERRATEENLKRQRMINVDELSKTLQEIRGHPGFERFQLPPSYEELIEVAKDGPVVIEVCTSTRSDAIIVTRSCIKSIPLPNLTHSVACRRIKELNTKIIPGGKSSYQLRSAKMERFLIWLWDTAVEPVIEELKTQGIVSSGDVLPRIWWIGADIMGLAPFHAAGDHSPGSTRNTLAYAISSYIPTLKALSYARERPLAFPHGDSSLLIVATPKVRGQSRLNHVNSEVESIVNLSPEWIKTEILNSPSSAEVLKQLPSFGAVHFACHGFSNINDPFNSHLLLRDVENCTTGVDRLSAEAISDFVLDKPETAYLLPPGFKSESLQGLSADETHERLVSLGAFPYACPIYSDENNPFKSLSLPRGGKDCTYGIDILTAGAISDINMERAQIAYLSACSTARISSRKLADESVHIASAFQLAGFSHVLANMWPSDDDACLNVTTEFYRKLFESSISESDCGHRKVGAAFHYAVKKLRDSSWKEPLLWTPFIHTGA